jgi:hypothetical protein
MLAFGFGLTVPAVPDRTRAEPGFPRYFPTTVGTKWVYEFTKGVQTEVVTRVRSKDGAVIVSVENELPGGKLTPLHTMALQADGLYMLDEVGQPYDPPVCVLKLPLKLGDRWEGKSSRPDLGGFRYASEVKEIKAIETPAGKFQAIGIDAGWSSRVDQGLRTDRRWYAADVGLLQIEGVRILKAFTPGKD